MMTLRLVASIAGAIVVVVGLAQLGGGPGPSPVPTSARIGLTLITEMAECGSIGGCAGYVSLTPADAVPARETRLSMLGPRGVTRGLPAFVEPGLYTVSFRQVAVSDLYMVVNGVSKPDQEWTMGTCSTALDLRDAAYPSAEISVLFTGADCDVTVEFAVAIP